MHANVEVLSQTIVSSFASYLVCLQCLPFSPIQCMSRVVWIILRQCSRARKSCLCFWEMIGFAKTVLWKGARMQDGGVAEVMYVLVEVGCFLESSSL